MKIICFLCVLLCGAVQLSGADLFGNEVLEAGEMSLAEQAELYQLFFGELDAAATSASKRLKLAVLLQQRYDEETYKGIKRHLLKRIDELSAGSKKKEAYDLAVFTFLERYKKRERNHQDNASLVDLLAKKLKKSPKEEREALACEIIALLNENAHMSLLQKSYEQAAEDFDRVATWYAKVGDKEGEHLSDEMHDYLEDHIKEITEAAALIDEISAGATDVKTHATLGRFYLKSGDWSAAHPYLVQAQQQTLSAIATIAKQEEQDPSTKGRCLILIAEALKEKEIKKDRVIKRALLSVGVRYRSDVRDAKEVLKPAAQLKYAMVSASFEDELEELGPDPLRGFAYAASATSVDEARLLREGWALLFDHESTAIIGGTVLEEDEAKSAKVRNGMLVIKTSPGHSVSLRNIPDQKKYKGIHIRFKFIKDPHGMLLIKVPGVNGLIVRTLIRGENVGLTTGYERSEYGLLKLKPDDWNDLQMIWDGNTAKGTVNGEPFAKAVPRPNDFTDIIQFEVGGNGHTEVHIQSVLGLKR